MPIVPRHASALPVTIYTSRPPPTLTPPASDPTPPTPCALRMYPTSLLSGNGPRSPRSSGGRDDEVPVVVVLRVHDTVAVGGALPFAARQKPAPGPPGRRLSLSPLARVEEKLLWETERSVDTDH
ncbi:hypothetical protein K438DRAFT_1959163 [Mycena galopus ATCC 62051]|nr:hypothetical protein K438DRAFT_1959163 [Mycena galopus ATCC 62051]